MREAQRLADRRRVNLSTVITEALDEGLRIKAAPERAEQILEGYKKAFAGFSEHELEVLDGIILEPSDDAS